MYLFFYRFIDLFLTTFISFFSNAFVIVLFKIVFSHLSIYVQIYFIYHLKKTFIYLFRISPPYWEAAWRGWCETVKQFVFSRFASYKVVWEHRLSGSPCTIWFRAASRWWSVEISPITISIRYFPCRNVAPPRFCRRHSSGPARSFESEISMVTVPPVDAELSSISMTTASGVSTMTGQDGWGAWLCGMLNIWLDGRWCGYLMSWHLIGGLWGMMLVILYQEEIKYRHDAVLHFKTSWLERICLVFHIRPHKENKNRLKIKTAHNRSIYIRITVSTRQCVFIRGLTSSLFSWSKQSFFCADKERTSYFRLHLHKVQHKSCKFPLQRQLLCSCDFNETQISIRRGATNWYSHIFSLGAYKCNITSDALLKHWNLEEIRAEFVIPEAKISCNVNKPGNYALIFLYFSYWLSKNLVWQWKGYYS